VAIVILVLELLMSLFVFMAGAITFGFAGESNRAPTPMGTVLQFTGLAISFLPLLVLGWTAWRRLGASTPWPSVPLGLWLPVIVNVVCFPLAQRVLAWSVSFRALVLVLVLVGLPQGALAQEDTSVQHIRDNFFKLENAVEPPHCQGQWCVVMVSHCCISGSTIYQLYLRDPAGNVTEEGSSIGSKPEFVLDDQGRFKLDEAMPPWSGVAGVDAQEQEATAPQTEPSQKARQAALAACKKASPSCASQFTSTQGTCNRRGCVLSTSHEDTAPYCFMWREAGSGKLDLLGVYAEDFGYSGPEYVLDPNAVSVVGSGCKNGCTEADSALGQDVQQPLETKRCGWSRVKKKQAAQRVPARLRPQGGPVRLGRRSVT